MATDFSFAKNHVKKSLKVDLFWTHFAHQVFAFKI